MASTSTVNKPSLSQQPKVRGGRPPKNASLEMKHEGAEDDDVTSEMSYESEEQ
jgi:hypothetical protein